MSGHSKWATTKRAKAVTDAKRGAIFTKLSNAISIAVRQKGADPEANFNLRLLMDKAKAANMPKEVVERAIQRAQGVGAEAAEEALYEGFGPCGVAVLVEAVTNNRNRTTGELRHLFSEHGGSLGAAGSTAWMFDHKGVLQIAHGKWPIVNREEFELKVIDAGAEDMTEEPDGGLTVVTSPDKLQVVKSSVEAQGVTPDTMGLGWFAKNPVAISAEVQGKLDVFTSALDEQSDVTEYYTNAV